MVDKSEALDRMQSGARAAKDLVREASRTCSSNLTELKARKAPRYEVPSRVISLMKDAESKLMQAESIMEDEVARTRKEYEAYFKQQK